MIYRTRAIQEILRTERDYVNDTLDTLVGVIKLIING